MTSRPIALLIGVAVLTSAPPAPAQPQSQQQTQPNAQMTIACLRKGKLLKSWSRPTHWNGPLPDTYKAEVRNGRLRWLTNPPVVNSIRIGTSISGRGGKTLAHWIPSGTDAIHISVQLIHRANGSSPLAGTGPNKPTKSAKKNRKRKRYSLTARRSRVPPVTGKTSKRNPRPARRPRDIKHRSKGDGQDTSRRARTAHVFGNGKLSGRDKGKPTGEAGGRTAEEGGVESDTATVTGDRFGPAHGMKGGDGDRSDYGVAGAGGLIGIINVPASVRHLTSVLLALNDASPGALASKWMAKVTTRTTARSLRKRLKTAATAYAEQRITRNITKVNEALRKLPASERVSMLNRWQWEIERVYFDNAARGAANKARALRSRLRKAQKREAPAEELRELNKQLRQATTLHKAATVKPLAGQLPRNHTYAGRAFPKSKLPSRYRGPDAPVVRVKPNGHPHFTPHAIRLPNGKRSVKITLTGSMKRDKTLANRAAGFKPGEVPDDHIWHHLEDGTTMELIPEDLHQALRHSGGQAMYRHRTGNPDAYRR